MDLTGGGIKFVSDPSVKPGTDCIVTIPFIKFSPVGVKPVEIKIQDVIKEKLSFLIIDDNTVNRALLRKRILKNIAPNSSVEEATNGEEALRIVTEIEKSGSPFDIIIVDQYMEETGGIMLGTDVVTAMRRLLVTSVIIGCSGNDFEGTFIKAGCEAV